MRGSKVTGKEKKMWCVPSNISEQRMLLDESEASRPCSLCWVALVPGSSGLLKDQLRKGALVRVTATLFMFLKINRLKQIAGALDQMECMFFYPLQ